ncbi:MAG: 2OG-Fe(II) oxygenase [Pseudomonadota bacterium]|nr:2OG-Fe(II) oxygenase [Pseudomonadota bacterium]
MDIDSHEPGDTELAILRSQAADGAPEAGYRLGLALVERTQLDEALSVYEHTANAGHAGAQVQLARMRLYGVACERDPEVAVRWLLRAEAEADNVMAGYLLALIALGGVALPRSQDINRRVLAAAKAEYPAALLAAAIHFGRRPDDADQARCISLLEHATRLGDTTAARLLLERLRRGEGCEAQPERATQLAQGLAARKVQPLARAVASAPAKAVDFMQPGVLALEEALQPPPATELARQPHVRRIDGLLSADECRLLMACAQPHLRRSRAVNPETGESIELEIRTSSDCSLDPMMESLAARVVQLRMAAAAKLELVHAEPLTVLRYQPGEQYRPHRDYAAPSAIERDNPAAGNRRRTICAYLNDVEAGGETEFPIAGITVAPVPGRAIVFDNLHPDGHPDPNSLHAGLPVKQGEKWLATLWMRERPYRMY